MFFAKEMAATVVLDFQGAQRSSKIEAPFPANTSTGFLAALVVAFAILAEPLATPVATATMISTPRYVDQDDICGQPQDTLPGVGIRCS